MDLLGAFKSEVFRPIASIVLPGMLAIGVFAVVLGNAVPEVRDVFQTQPLLFFSLLFGAATIVGMLLENIGSSIERGIDTCMEREYLFGSGAVWAAYLAAPCTDTYARRYLGTLVTRLKFINSMIPATTFFVLGLVALSLQLDRWSWWGMFLLFFLPLIMLISWLFKSSVELSEAALFARLKMLPLGHGIKLNTDAHTVGRFRHFAYAVTELRTSRIEEIDFKELKRGALLFEVIRVLVPLSPKVIEATRARTS
jgi:hypothetical protein